VGIDFMKKSQFKKLIQTIITEVENHSESDMSNPEEKREVQIGKKILTLLDEINPASSGYYAEPEACEAKTEIEQLANELIKMHTAQSTNEDMAFTNNVGYSADGISEGNVVDELNLSSSDIAPIEYQTDRIKAAWRQLIQSQNKEDQSEDAVNALYDAVHSLEWACKDIRMKLDLGLKE